ncbi:MBL fold metallo-hydrolase [Amycolatopsis sp. NPDC088138]|uniref:MBL fold metallo-hydrolase n=1 Tax=Amycolatopsis sp. NPDC088138 TaxID=3363938 RepID=UPI00380FD004
MPEAVVEPLLLGYGLSSAQGSIGFCGVYLVHAAGRRILFDCGHTGRRKALLRALGTRSVDTLVLSHAHWDHVQNADLFPDVLIHPDEDLSPRGNPVAPPWTSAILAHARPATDGLEPAPGVTVTALPGHTAGSIGLTVTTAAGVALLTGDAVPSARSVRAGRCATAVDEGAAARSLSFVQAHADVVYPGHDRPFTMEGGQPGRYLLPRADLAAGEPDPRTREPGKDASA